MNDRCCLCGGKISEGRCVECGMPEQKTTCNLDGKQSENIREETCKKTSKDKFLNGKTIIGRAVSKKTVDGKAPTVKRSNGKVWSPRTKHKGIRVLAFLAAFCLILGSCGSLITEIASDIVSDPTTDSEGYNYTDADESYDPYEYVDEELPEGEESWSETLGSGFYEVGVHIPAGEYKVTLESGYGAVQMTNNALSLYVSEYMDTDEEGTATEMTLRCYPGSIVEITAALHVNFSTDTAESLELDGVENDLVSTYEFNEDNDETCAVAGEDFEAGIYDLSSGEDMGSIEFSVDTDDGEWSELFGVYKKGDVAKNIVIPEGTEITIYGDVILTPSQTIGADWGEDFYDCLY